METKYDQTRTTLTFRRFKDLANTLVKVGVPPNKIKSAMLATHKLIDEISGYGSRQRSNCAYRCIDMVTTDIKNKHGNKKLKPID